MVDDLGFVGAKLLPVTPTEKVISSKNAMESQPPPL